MAENEDNVEINVDSDESLQKPDEKELVIENIDKKSSEIAPEDGIESLRQQLAAEKAARIAAEKDALEAKNRVVSAQNEVQDTNLQLINNAIETVKSNTQQLKASYTTAMAAGDYDAAADIQQSMADHAAKLLQLEQGKKALEDSPKQKPIANSDPVEALAAQLSPRSAAWVRANPDFARNQNKYNKMIAAHQLAIADGLQADTDEYFAAIEETLKIRRDTPTTDSASADAARVTQRRDASPPAAAPVSRNTSSRPNVVRLTSEEREMAKMMGMTDQDYAKNKLALQREGKLN